MLPGSASPSHGSLTGVSEMNSCVPLEKITYKIRKDYDTFTEMWQPYLAYMDTLSTPMMTGCRFTGSLPSVFFLCLPCLLTAFIFYYYYYYCCSRCCGEGSGAVCLCCHIYFVDLKAKNKIL